MAYTAERKEVNLFVGPTAHHHPRRTKRQKTSPSSRGPRKRFERTRPEHATVGVLLYVLLDELVDGYFARNDEVEDHIEELEERILVGAPSCSGRRSSPASTG